MCLTEPLGPVLLWRRFVSVAGATGIPSSHFALFDSEQAKSSGTPVFARELMAVNMCRYFRMCRVMSLAADVEAKDTG